MTYYEHFKIKYTRMDYYDKSLFFILFSIKILDLMHMRFLPVNKCATCMAGTLGGQKRESDPLELELQMVVKHQMGARNTNRGSLHEQQVFLTTEPSF